MAEDNPNNPDIERAGHENENEGIRQDVQERVEHNRVENRQEMPNAQVGAQGGYPPWGYNQGNYGNAQGKGIKGNKETLGKQDNINHKELIKPKANPTIKVNFLKVKEDSKMLLNNFREEAAVQYPPGFEPGAKLPNNEGRPSQEDAIEAMFKKMDEYMKSNNNQMKSMEYQIGQLATTVGHMQNKGKFPSTTEPNPKEHCKAIELRSGTKYQGPSLPSEDNVEEREHEIEQEAEDDKVSEKDEDEEIAPLSEIKKKLEKDESAQPVPKWKRIREEETR
ncbi:hypothetical protein ACS0TY_018129 [Phlomoides rotata]